MAVSKIVWLRYYMDVRSSNMVHEADCLLSFEYKPSFFFPATINTVLVVSQYSSQTRSTFFLLSFRNFFALSCVVSLPLTSLQSFYTFVFLLGCPRQSNRHATLVTNQDANSFFYKASTSRRIFPSFVYPLRRVSVTFFSVNAYASFTLRPPSPQR